MTNHYNRCSSREGIRSFWTDIDGKMRCISCAYVGKPKAYKTRPNLRLNFHQRKPIHTDVTDEFIVETVRARGGAAIQWGNGLSIWWYNLDNYDPRRGEILFPPSRLRELYQKGLLKIKYPEGMGDWVQAVPYVVNDDE